MRYDYSSLFGGYLTPRIHTKYNLNDNTVLRVSGGRGHRSTNVIAENAGLLSSSREIIFMDELMPEDAWNAGINFTHDFILTGDKELSLSLDYYRTQFINQVVVDMDMDKNSIYFYNLDGESFSNSFQVELSSQPLPGFEITGAFRLNDVRITLNDLLQEEPYLNKYKGLITTSYTTISENWKFDLTLQYNGSSRLPDISQNINTETVDLQSPGYIILHSQVTRNFKYFSIYAGGENLTDFVQDHPIIDPQNPFGQNFDATRVWGPILGRMFFLGVRFDLE